MPLPGFRRGPDCDKHSDNIAEAQRLPAEAGVSEGFEANITARTVAEYVDLALLLSDQLRRYLDGRPVWPGVLMLADAGGQPLRSREREKRSCCTT